MTSENGTLEKEQESVTARIPAAVRIPVATRIPADSRRPLIHPNRLALALALAPALCPRS